MDRTEALAALAAAGLSASIREWCVGQSIMVVSTPRMRGGLRTCSRMVYLYPEADGSWTIDDCGYGEFDETRHRSLESAVASVLAQVRRLPSWTR
ncbi:hypothetical protein DF3PB_220023 [uncultured Defluviicoccus sp.]|uniref:Uncharacterized protein n=1 Tax=metagenome TaxID=256318 RepID=A0A380TBR1_9ZZZZ|nr:hypothetical protein DF3PB_220023 [uncultured Defluviicoccus sp.]